MGQINLGRVVIGGLLAGLIINIGEFILNGLLLEEQMNAAMAALNKPQRPSNDGRRNSQDDQQRAEREAELEFLGTRDSKVRQARDEHDDDQRGQDAEGPARFRIHCFAGDAHRVA